MSSSSPSYWCYRCNRLTRVLNHDAVSCPDCNGGFVEQIDTPILQRSSPSDGRRRRFPAAAAMYMIGNRADSDSDPDPTPSRTRMRNGGDRSPFNPVIVLRNHPDGSSNVEGGGGGGFELYYDDGVGSGLRPLPPSMSEFLLGSGFDRLLDQLTQIEMNGLSVGSEHQPASKAAIESMPAVEISEMNLNTDSQSHCAVCKEEFELRVEAREMPCKHLYHSECIIPWLALRNSCPVCRHEMPTDHNSHLQAGGDDQVDEPVGLTIWRLPGGGFAVGRFTGGRRSEQLPVVYTEMDGGGFNNGNGVPRRVTWDGARGNGGRRSGGVSRMFRNLFGCFTGSSSSSSVSSSASSSDSSRRSRSMIMFDQGPRRRRGWSLQISRQQHGVE